MKALFIDIDGVLLPGRAHRIPEPDPRVHRFDPVAVDMIRELVKETGTKLVWSTTWRGLGKSKLDEIAVVNGFDLAWFHESRMTPDRKFDKTSEIAAWIVQHAPSDWFALDDHDELQGGYAGSILGDPFGIRRPRFSAYDGITTTIYSQASVVLGSRRFATRYMIGRGRDGAMRLFITFPQPTRLRSVTPEKLIGDFALVGDLWFRLDRLVEDEEILSAAKKKYDVSFDVNLQLSDLVTHDPR